MLPSQKGTHLTEKFRSALVMAALFHGNQIRTGSEDRPIPCLTNPLEVAATVLAESVPEEVAIAALLHDGPEDAGGRPTLDPIRLAFGDRVKDIVAACTDTFEAKKPDWPVRSNSIWTIPGKPTTLMCSW
jgi:(p)ppGpp synthase/HD superfamily hydrolase